MGAVINVQNFQRFGFHHGDIALNLNQLSDTLAATVTPRYEASLESKDADARNLDGE